MAIKPRRRFSIPRSGNGSSRRTYDPAYVRSLFDSIAPRYDLLNHLLSSGIDIQWRSRTIELLARNVPQDILDVATGTGDLAIEARRLKPRSITGIDLSPAMLARAREKVRRRGLRELISFQEGQVERLPFRNSSFDAVMVAFGVRNFSSLERGLREMVRVLRPGGILAVLEFSRPESPFLGKLYHFYSTRVLPRIGGAFSRREAYEYLPNTIGEFPMGKDFLSLLDAAGLRDAHHIPLTFGIAAIYHGTKGKRSRT